MSKYKVLPSHLHTIADAAETIIKLKYGLGNALIETPIEQSLSWSPTLHWKTKVGFIACEVHETPFPVSVKTAFGDGTTIDLPIKIIVALPNSIHRTQSDYIKESNDAKRFGCGLITINDDGTGSVQHLGIEIPLYIPIPKFTNFNKKLRAEVQHAYELYINSDPRHGVQEIGQLIENIMIHLAVQAKKKGKLISGGFVSSNIPYSQGNLIDDLMRDRVIDNAILGKCRGFVEDRNGSSHKPKSVKNAIEINRKLKNAMSAGLLILEEIPQKLKSKGYTLKIT
jgi:hypothetical protein